MNPVLEARNVSGGYTRAPILRDISFSIDPDQVLAFFGANGAGKTTLLRALAGTLPVCQGDVLIDGRSVNLSIGPFHRSARPWSRVKAGLAHVPEGRHVFTQMSVRDNLAAAGLVGKGRVPVERVFELFPRLRERAKQFAGSLSGGEQQMLAIGRAIMTDPKVLAIDEMSAGLAPVIVDQLVAGLRQLKGSGVAVLLVEQAPHFIAGLVDRVYLLERGRVIGEGTLDELGGVERLADLYLGVTVAGRRSASRT
jgi:branched-chain amino acid transport system ATP-binding protein